MNHKSIKSLLLRPVTVVIILAILFSSGAAAQSLTPPIAGARIIASEAGDWFWPTEFNEVQLQITIYASEAGVDPPLWAGTAMPDGNGFVLVGVDTHGQDLQPGNLIAVSDGTNSKSLVLESMSMEVFDTASDIMAGTARIGAEVWAFAGPMEWQQPFQTSVSPETGAWYADFSSIGFDITEDMRPWSYAHIYDADGDANEIGTPPPEFNDFRDDFDGPLADGWDWVNENADQWNLTEAPGFLRIYTSPYPTGDENLLFRGVSEPDFAIETHLLFEPDTNFQIAGLVIYQDDANFLQFGRAFCDVAEFCVGNGIYFDYVVDDSVGVNPNFATPVSTPNEAFLRLEKRGEMVRALYSYEGITWFEIGTHWISPGFVVNGVGLTSSQNTDPESIMAADFNYFEVTPGHGFLPEGYHDYDQGDVPSWACNAGGWAVDPDDRDFDINVEINVDGEKIEEFLPANEYRSDLEESGGCVEGSCGFFTTLWDRITSYETHQVTAYAQDIETGEWVRLSASPKELTCRTFDIYTFDPATGETVQVTNMRDADEYNPAWSPNGKLVVHHTVFIDGSGGLYITDVNTGESYPLPGADGGGWQTWSPNGRWIIFGMDNNLYMVPPTGTETPIRVRENAEMASFAPNGKRIVFRDTTDGSIRTMPVDHGKGRETTLAPDGNLPEWSPDGNWIVYDDSADIWKVPVNINGVKLGDPVRLTNLPQVEGHATWSPDGLTIVFHAGIGGDWDLWSVPAVGGEPAWLTGTPEWGDYDPAYMKNGNLVAYAGLSPKGQAPRSWVAAFTYDLADEYWTEGSHSYQFALDGSPQNDPMNLEVSSEFPLYDGKVLLRPFGLRAFVGDGCANLEFAGINPSQLTRFNVGWTYDGTYVDALAFYASLQAQVAWDGGDLVEMQRHEIFPFTPQVDFYGYICSFTAE